MAPSKDKWIRRFVISETSRHKKGFTTYKVTSVMFSKTTPDIVSKVSVWKRYSDFRKLYNTIQALHSTQRIKEPLPPFPKPRFFGRFEAEVIEERRECAIRLLEFIGYHNGLFTSDVFVKFFESDCSDKKFFESSYSLSSDSSEEDKNVSNDNEENTDTDFPKFVCNEKMKPVIVSKCNGNLGNISYNSRSLPIKKDVENHHLISKNDAEISFNDVMNGVEAISCEEEEYKINCVKSNSTVVIHDGSDLTQCIGESAQYILIAAAHMSAAFRHEAIAEYEEAFTQYKLGTSHLINGCQSEVSLKKKAILQEKIKKYLQRAERLYNRHLNCNVSALHKPVTELKNYKVVKLMESIMLVKDILQEFERVIKSVEKVAGCKKDISNFILKGKVPYMVQLYSCMQTESTVFLVLQYIRKGKMWDFAKLNYKSDKRNTFLKKHSRSISCDAVIQINSINNSPKNLFSDKEVNYLMTPEKNCSSPSNKFASKDVTELVINAQKLLESVNDTLKRSNSIATRLNESDCLMYKQKQEIENISDLNSGLKTNSILENNEDTENSGNLSEISISDSFMDLNEDKLQENNTKFQLIMDCKSIENVSLKNSNDSNSVDQSSKENSNNEIAFNNFEDQFQLVNIENSSSEEENKMWTIPESTVKVWGAQILLALEALHQQDVIISDLRPDNILIDDFDNVSMTYIVPRKDTELLRLKRPYSSPELCMLTPPISITSSADVWSFGVLLYELLTGFDFELKHPGQFHSHSLVNIPDNLSNDAKLLLLNILKFQPCDRLTIPEIKQDSFFSDIDWLDLLNAQV